MDARKNAKEIFLAAVQAVQPSVLLKQYINVREGKIDIGGHTLSPRDIKHIFVVGAGKAAAAMAVETEKLLGNFLSEGLVVTKYQHSLPAKEIQILEAAHPVPDENSIRGTRETIRLLKKAGPDAIVICLLSGGASSLWADLPPGINLDELQQTFDVLLKSGATIYEMNAVRKHLSHIKGGQMVKYCRNSKLFTLIISDVPGDELDVIASGPTVPDHSTFAEVYSIIGKYGLLETIPVSVRSYIEKGISGGNEETPKPGDKLFQNTFNFIMGSNAVALQGAKQMATKLKYHVVLEQKTLTGDTEEIARNFIRQFNTYSGPLPCCILIGGETTLKVTGDGKGGRNQHFVLSCLSEMNKIRNLKRKITVFSGGTDGTDGITDAAGAVGDMETIKKAASKKIDPDIYLKNFDAWNFFDQCSGLVVTGPTQTNVMDMVLFIIE